jgi:diacylglycerol kinase (ATP)
MDNLKKHLISFRNAWKGIQSGFKTELHFRFHVFAAFIAIASALFFNITRIEWMIVLLCIAAVLSSELLNTAVERICDRITKDLDPLIGNAKDLAAGSVLIISAAALIIGAIIFVPYIICFVQVIYK